MEGPGKKEKEIESPKNVEGEFENFIAEEQEIINKASKMVENLPPQKLKIRAASLLAAFSIFMSTSSAFAENQKLKVEENLFPENQIEASAKKLSLQEMFEKMIKLSKDEVAPFDWKKVADKIEISVGGTIEKIPEYQPEAVVDINSYNIVVSSEFYRNLSKEGATEAVGTFYNSIRQSNNSVEFFDSLKNQKENLSDQQKALFLQNLATSLKRTYNFDMFDASDTVEISDDIMFGALKELLITGKIKQTGMCGNISTFIVKTAENLGIEAWLQSGSLGGTRDIFTGVTIEQNGKKQIAFLTYFGDLIPVGTLDYRDALGIYERYGGSVATFNNFVGDEKEMLFPIKSRAQEVVEKAAGIEETGARLEQELADGKIKKENGLEIKLSPEIKEIKLTKDYFGIAYFNFQDVSNNPYQSLEDLNAVRGRLNLKGERLGLEADATILHMNIKDLYGGSIARDEIIIRLAADYINSHKFTKSEYGQFSLNWGATLQSALKLPLDEKLKLMTVSGIGEGALGTRLIYVNPSETGKFYIGASDMYRGQSDDFQNQDLIIKEVAKTLTIGSEIKVNEVQIVNFEVVVSELDYGQKLKLKGGFEGKEWKAGMEYEKTESEYKRFVPSSEKVSAKIGYKGGPKWEIDILGSKKTEQYKNAKTKDVYVAEVKLKIFLW